MFSKLLEKLFKTVSHQEIIDAIDPWILSCAVGAATNQWQASRLNLELWITLSKRNWVPEVRRKTGASESRILEAIRNYVTQNKHRNYKEIHATESERRELKHGPILGPGESMTISVNIPLPGRLP